ncbi:MAG: hypothetical protein Q7T49_00330, partial [bacterium]|nr:hypothetical protein [bacterium]
MKNKILILFLIGVVTPQLVFAAWWNPFTWSIFHMSGKKTQVIETQQSVELGNRFELGNRYGLVNNATSTTSTTSRNSSKIKKTTALPKSPTLSPVISPAPTTYIEPWEQIEPKNFVYGDQVGWTAMLITHPTTGEKRYYRKEGTQWVRKSSQAEAMQPYQSAIQPAAQP